LPRLPIATLRYRGGRLALCASHAADDTGFLGDGECVYDWTPRHFAGRAAPYGIRENALHGLQVSDFRPNLCKVIFRQFAHISACVRPIIG
jgi:hypothetical protein